jgi:hypothetical protein
MSKELRYGIGAAVAGGSIALAVWALTSFDEDQEFVWLALIAMAPATFMAFSLWPELARRPDEAARLFTAPLGASCMALSFLLLAVVVGGTLWGWPGAVAGAAVGALLGADVLVTMRLVHRALVAASQGEAPQMKVTLGSAAAASALSVAGFVALLVVLSGFTYLLAGSAAAVALAGLTVLLFAVLLTASVVTRRRQARD